MRKSPDLEHGSPAPKSRVQRLSRSYSTLPRIVRFLFLTAIAFLVGRDLAIRIQGDFDYRLKILPTDFGPLGQRASEALWAPQQPVRFTNGTNIDDRYVLMRHLGTGNEGSASLYVDTASREVVVVKTWLGPLKNIRNILPCHLETEFADSTSKWPSEIEAGLLLETWNDGNDTAFVPVRDYFILQHDAEHWNWAMVTPFVEGGTLSSLAKATKIHERSPQKLDKIFRPAFNSLLVKLSELHEAGYCHDDIKGDNIFVPEPTHWLLGDLGNVRHAGHPWHATGRWQRENQKPDCKENDLRRLLKTYMTFLREAAASEATFDTAFYDADQAWSRLYWDFVRSPVPAHELVTASDALRSGEDVEVKVDPDHVANEDACLARKIDRELTFWTVKTSRKDWLPFRGC